MNFTRHGRKVKKSVTPNQLKANRGSELNTYKADKTRSNHEPFPVQCPRTIGAFTSKRQPPLVELTQKVEKKKCNQMRLKEAYKFADSPLLQQILVQRDAMIPITAKMRIVTGNTIEDTLRRSQRTLQNAM